MKMSPYAFRLAAVLALLALLLSTGAQAARKGPPFTQADCADPTLTLELNTQAAVDSFPCTTVAGDLEISIRRGETILYLPLDQLTRVDGELLLSFSNIGAPTSLDGLVNVAHVGSLSVKADIPGQPDQLTDISGLASLTSIGPRNCQPALDPADCYTTLSLTSDEITQLPAWNIANDSIEELKVIGFPLTDPAEWDSLPVPSRSLSLSQVALDTNQPAQLDTLKRLTSQAQGTVFLQGISNLVALPAMPNAASLRLADAALPDLSAITSSAFPDLDRISLDGLAGISPAELAPIRDINNVNLTGMTGLGGANPLAGLAGGSFRKLILQSMSSVTTLTDLLSVTALDSLRIRDMDGLTNLAGLDNLTSIADELFINECDNLQNVDAFSSLASIGGDLSVEKNPALQNLDGLSGASGTLREVNVFANPQLTDISGLAGITGVSETVAVLRNAVTECDVLVKSRLNPQPSRTYLVNPACVYAAPSLSSSASALDFGSGSIGTTIDRSVTFENSTGSISTTVDISAVSISGDTLGEYSVLSEDCTSGALTGGSNRNACTVTVRYTVGQVGVDNAQLDITYTTSENGTPQSYPVTLTGAGTGVSGAQLSPNTNLDFGKVELGASKTDTITIDNSGGSGPLTVTALKVKGGDFKLTNNSCGDTYPQSVPVGSQCLVTIRFTPSALNARASLFTMESNGATSPDNVNLIGVGVEPPAPLPNTTSLDFGDVPVGTTSARQFVVVKNASPIRSLPLGQLSARGDFAVQSDTCSGATLPPTPQAGSLCVVYVTFNPTTTGTSTGTLTIPGASGYPSASVALSGNGLQPATLTAAPTNLAFGTQTSPSTLSVTVTNIGAAGQDAQIGTASVTGTLTPQQFAIDTDACSGTTLAGQGTCQISVTFDPFQAGADTGTLEIPYNSGQVLSVALSGRGGDPVDYVTPASLSFGNVPVGDTSAPQTVTVTDNSGIALDIASVSAQGSGFLVQNDSCTGTTVNPGGSCSFEVTFTALGVGHVVSTVEVRSNSSSSPDEVIVDGFGATPLMITATVASGSGTVSCTPNTVTAGGSSTCTAVPASGYQVLQWSGDCASAGSNAQCALSNIQADQTATVSFVPIPSSTYSVSATVVGGNYGVVSCLPNSVLAGGNSACYAVPYAGFQVQSWGGACASAASNAQCTLTNIQANQVATVSFELIPTNSYSVTATVVGGNYGTVSCLPNSVLAGGNSTCYAVPYAGFQVQSWSGACAAAGSNAQCTLTKIQADQVAAVSFELIPTNSYSVTATATDANGSVSCLPNTVLAGQSSVCYAVPHAGFAVQSWSGACAGAGSAGQCDLTNIQADQVSTVSFQALSLPTYSVTATVSGGNGTVSCAPASVNKGDSSSCTAVPDVGYQVAAWTGACASAGTNAQCYLGKLQKDAVSTVSFSAIAANSYSVSATAILGHGAVSCTPATVASGGSSTCTATPDTGYQVQHWGGACAAWGSNAQCYLSKIKADQAATVSFALLPPATYSVSATVSGGQGSVSCIPGTVTAGGASRCTAVPDAGYQVASWSGACAGAGSAAQCDLTGIQSDQSATVSFVALAVPSFSVSASVAAGNGTVSCSPSPVPQGGSSSCTAIPAPGDQVAGWTGACAGAGSNVHCALTNIQADQTPTVSFAPIPLGSYSVTASVALGQGAVSCTPATVTAGGSSTCTAIPGTGDQVQSWGGACAAWGSNAACYLTKIKSDQVATVSFAPRLPASHSVSATVSGGHGTVSCTPSSVTKYDASTCTAVPEAGYQVELWSGACAGTAPHNPQCYLTKIEKDALSTVSFVALPVNHFAVSATVVGGHGTVSCTPASVAAGGASSCTAVPEAGYQVAHWDGACLLAGQNAQCNLANIQSDQTSTVAFALMAPATYSVTATVVGGHGAVSCTPASVRVGGGSTCTANPDQGYRVGAWSGDCASAGGNAQCVLSNIQRNQNATVNFRLASPGGAVAVPALSTWGLALLSLLMLMLAAPRLRLR
ncbi:IPTL-CTERM sorting domain-containing protein [Thiorhodococcus mannitoliphagus]|uniref:IPTL-CTERM sorting domain-containing protein n=1 Tax=Thiorhodococcus mannitoliphagus TaxID=329406 RepID=A0A6P1E2X0_9GAMM|nr:IPTL-CTERM sorting domain-containing protein [Thiorhodococcus mannitoliphagus]NEX22035.1 IPTL-CTERM sorting domain-containing protein [Thiorhodococcus mannitoliphagus]